MAEIKNEALGYNPDQVGIPGVFVNVEGGSSVGSNVASPTGGTTNSSGITNDSNTQENIPLENTPTPVVEGNTSPSTTLSDTISNTIKEGEKDIVDRTKDLNARAKEDAQIAITEKANIEDATKKSQELIKQRDADLKIVEEKAKAEITKREQADIENLKAEKNLAERKLQREAELQKSKDESAIRAAEKSNYIAGIQAAVAYNKLGLMFSSGAINTSQQITVDGANRIAELKVQASYNQADIADKIEQTSLNYTKEINKTIAFYTDKQTEIDTATKERIYNTQNSLLLSEKEKNAQILAITKEYVSNKRATEDQLYTEITAHKNTVLVQTQALQQELRVEEDRNKVKLEQKLSSGAWYNMSIEEKKEWASKSGMAVTDVDNLLSNGIQSSAYKAATAIMGADFMFTQAENILLQDQVEILVKSGVGLEEAVNRATNNLIRRNPEYTKIQEQKALEDKVKIKELKDALKPITTKSGSKITTSQMKQGSDGLWYAWTGGEWVSTGLSGKQANGQQIIEDGILKEQGGDGIYRPVYSEQEVSVPGFSRNPTFFNPSTSGNINIKGYAPVKNPINIGTKLPEEDDEDEFGLSGF